MIRGLYRHAVRTRWFYAVLASALIFYESSLPIRLPGHIPQLDKAVHVLLYFGLALSYFNAATRGGTRTGARACWIAFLLASAYGISDEWHQAYVPGRTADWQDWAADTVGAAAAVWLGWRLRARSARWGDSGASATGRP